MKTFYQLLGNNLLATMTNFTVWFALIFFVYLQTHSVFATSIISGIYLLAVATTGFWLGSLVDHHRKKNVMLLSSVASLFIYLIGFALYLISPPDAFTRVDSLILWIFVPLVMMGVISGNLRNIALPTLVTILIPEDRRDKANGLVGTASGISFLIVSVISGFLVALGGMYYAFLFAIIVTVGALIHLWFIPVAEKEIKHSLEQPKKLDIRGTLKAIFAVPGLFALILFATFNNFLGGVFMSLMDAYGLSLISVEAWGLLWGFISVGFIIGGLLIAKWGLGKNPLRSLFLANIVIWIVCSLFTLQSSIIFLTIGMFIYLTVMPFIEASEQTIIQKVVPQERQGRVFGFAQSLEQAASPLTAFLIGPIAQFIFIPFMTTGAGVQLIGGWFGTGSDRGIALVFTLTGIIGLIVTILAMHSKPYKLLSKQYVNESK
jgi:DHA3 family multidrug efflux protein-like MFS transporter